MNRWTVDFGRLDWIILPTCKETTTNSIKLRFDESSRTSLTGLSVLLHNAMFIFALMNPVGSILGRRHRFRGKLPRIRICLAPSYLYTCELLSVERAHPSRA